MPFIILRDWRSESETLPLAEPVRSDWACSERWPCYPATLHHPPSTNPTLSFSLSGCLMTDQDSFISLRPTRQEKGGLLQGLSKHAGSRGNNWQKQGDFHWEIDDGAEGGLISKLLGRGEGDVGSGDMRKQWLDWMRGRGGDAPNKVVFGVEMFFFWHLGQLKAKLKSSCLFKKKSISDVFLFTFIFGTSVLDYY